MQDKDSDVVIEPEAEDLSPRDTESDEGAEAAEGKMQKLRKELAECRKEKQEYMDGWQRAKADYVNALKRFAEDAQAIELKGRIRALEALLPALDALERSKEHLPAMPAHAGQAGGELSAGFAAIAKQLESAFASLGVEETGKVGERFNPAFHEALGADPAESLETDDTITVVLEKGWRVGTIIVRPAKVRVGHFTSEKSDN